MAAEQKARSTYEYILNLTDDPDVIEPIRFLREREIVHLQRFGEALRKVQDYLDSGRCYVMPKNDLFNGNNSCDNSCDNIDNDFDNNTNCNKSKEKCNNFNPFDNLF